MENILFTIFDILNFGWVAFLWGFTLKNYNTLPERIPVHFDMEGKADGFGGKMYAFLMPVLALGLYAVFTYGTRHPEDTNFPVEITDQNTNAQFLIMKIGLRILFVVLAMVFLNLQDYMFRYAVDDKAKPRISIATIFLSVVLFTPALLFIAYLFK
ncbi:MULTISPECIES: DUF1648 domain-containing protein [unclassified Chryseobacterium]|uniref:DUF1648 domain-containing protein n=1 Tax=unclassified Chryseobacterium TaxID=2593645 RepID=UPI000D712B1F|nr:MULTISPECIES: DUF1648 domain-containing protein [unclassified Chryseobacterium]PWW30996.1 uncharacterized protein DUF1648 [Chryseobacterium sp. AG844]